LVRCFYDHNAAESFFVGLILSTGSYLVRHSYRFYRPPVGLGLSQRLKPFAIQQRIHYKPPSDEPAERD
jgi:hypothetical protein